MREEMEEDGPGVDIGSLPTIDRDDKTVKRRLEKAKREERKNVQVPVGNNEQLIQEEGKRTKKGSLSDISLILASRIETSRTYT